METVDAMTLSSAEVPGPLRVVRVLRNGKRWFDPVEKERLIDACLEPGVSVAGLALAHGINANQLRKWVKLAAKGKLQPGTKEITPEQMELSRLRAENARLKLENEILKKATVGSMGRRNTT